MGKTYRRSTEDDYFRKKPKHHQISKRSRSEVYEEDEDFFDDEVNIRDNLIINKTRDEES